MVNPCSSRDCPAITRGIFARVRRRFRHERHCSSSLGLTSIRYTSLSLTAIGYSCYEHPVQMQAFNVTHFILNFDSMCRLATNKQNLRVNTSSFICSMMPMTTCSPSQIASISTSAHHPKTVKQDGDSLKTLTASLK